MTKRQDMIKFWSERAREYDRDPRANTNDVWLREIEINYVDHLIKLHSAQRALDFGCANGFSTARLAQANPSVNFLGIDINPDMIKVASGLPAEKQLSNLAFRQGNVLEDEFTEKFDFIYGIRVFQNIESPEIQKTVFDKLHQCLSRNGRFLYIESYLDGYTRINEDRVNLGLTPLPIHPHLTLLTDAFDDYVAKKMTLLETSSLSSSYYLITRLVYSYLAKMKGEPIDYNHPLHQIAAMVPQVGAYGPQRANLFQKTA